MGRGPWPPALQRVRQELRVLRSGGMEELEVKMTVRDSQRPASPGTVVPGQPDPARAVPGVFGAGQVLAMQLRTCVGSPAPHPRKALRT